MTSEEDEKLVELVKENEQLKGEVVRLSRLLARKGAENVRNQKRARDLIKDMRARTQALEAQKEEAEKQNKELERVNRVMTGRELKMVQLKKRIAYLKGRLEETKKELRREKSKAPTTQNAS